MSGRCSEAVLLSWECAREVPGDLCTTVHFHSVGLGWGLRYGMSSKLQDAAGPRVTPAAAGVQVLMVTTKIS